MFLGAHARFQVSLLKKLCFSAFVLNSIEVKDFRFIIGVQFHLMVPVSFLFCLELKFKEKSFCVYRGQWDISIILPKTSVSLGFHC